MFFIGFSCSSPKGRVAFLQEVEPFNYLNDHRTIIYPHDGYWSSSCIFCLDYVQASQGHVYISFSKGLD